MSAAGQLAQFGPVVSRNYAGATTATNGMTAASNESGRLYNMTLDTGVQTLNLPPVSAIPDGYSVVVRATGLPIGFQTAYVSAEAGKTIVYRDNAAQKFYLIGKSEVFRFTWLSGLGFWIAECLAQPGQVFLFRYLTGTTSWNSGSTAFTPITFNTNAGDIAVFNVTNQSYTILPVTGVWRNHYQWQPSASAGGGTGGSAGMVVGNPVSGSGSNSMYGQAYDVLTYNEDTVFQLLEWTANWPQGSYSLVLRNSSVTTLWFYPANNACTIELVSR